MAAPPPEVVSAIEAGSTGISRRIEFYEADGTTPWYPANLETSRLIDGTVNVDYNRDERRSLDLVLDNVDNALRSDPNGGLWYDKVIKTYRGVRYPSDPAAPKTLIIASSTANGYAIRASLAMMGYTDTDVSTNITSIDQLAPYKIIVHYSGSTAGGAGAAMGTILQQAYANGKAIFTIGSQNNTNVLPFVSAITNDTTIARGLTPTTYDSPLKGGWSDSGTIETTAGDKITAVDITAQVVATWLDAGNPFFTAVVAQNSSGGRWFNVQLANNFMTNTQGFTLGKNGMTWLRNYQAFNEWEVQLGEFLIDRLDEDRYPHQIKVTGRDYTKRCMNSKMEKSVGFVAGTPVTQLIKSVAANAGILKFQLPDLPDKLSARLDFDRTTERWKVMKDAAASINYELFFTPQGYLTMRPFVDPAFGALSWTFQTGTQGNLVSWSRSTNDSRLYNHIIITGEPADETTLPFFGEAKNEEPSSPTRIARIGDRAYFYTSSFFTSDAQCQALANSWLKIRALESYEMSWSSFNYPWMEVGEVVDFLDPRRIESDPTRFLMDTLNIPMGLGPMTATAKRVTYVNDPNSVPDEEEEAA